MSIIPKELSENQLKELNHVDGYKACKDLLKTIREVNVQLGEVYYITYFNKQNEKRYVCRGYGARAVKQKFIIYHIDEDNFVFAKKINASGKLGAGVTCLTYSYPNSRFKLEPDPEYVEHILFESEGSYDPVKQEKENNKKKNKLRRMNKKIEKKFETAQEAFNYISTLDVGDKIWDARTAYGQDATEWIVKSIERRKTCKRKVNTWGSNEVGSTHEDRLHNSYKLDDYIHIELDYINKPAGRWIRRRKITFRQFMKNNKHFCYYDKKPFTMESLGD